MRKMLVLSVLLLVAAAACRTKEKATKTVGEGATPVASATTAQPSPDLTTSRPGAAIPATPSLVSLSSGGTIVRKPQELQDEWQAIWILDENPETGWAAPEGVTTNQSMVIALPERTVLNELVFDTAGVDGDGRAAKDLTVEMSDTGPESGFGRIADVTLADRADGQRFPATGTPGRWVRLTVKSNHGDPQYVELMDFRATGRQLTDTPFRNVSGTYETDYGPFHLEQQGTSLSGCYETRGGLINGGLDGRVMSLTWREGEWSGPAVMVFSPDGNGFTGIWWHNGESNPGGVWNGRRTSDRVGACGHWSSRSVEQTIASELETSGRSRVYGINFDPDSDHIKEASRPTLDQIANLMKSRPQWNLSIEGHTDSTSTEEHNRQLSEARANSVKNYLVAAGVQESRLTTEGFGASRPVASNDTALGRAQNRRVELVRTSLAARS